MARRHKETGWLTKPVTLPKISGLLLEDLTSKLQLEEKKKVLQGRKEWKSIAGRENSLSQECVFKYHSIVGITNNSTPLE